MTTYFAVFGFGFLFGLAVWFPFAWVAAKLAAKKRYTREILEELRQPENTPAEMPFVHPYTTQQPRAPYYQPWGTGTTTWGYPTGGTSGGTWTTTTTSQTTAPPEAKS